MYPVNKSITDNDIKERRSVGLITSLLIGKANPMIQYADKQANIDGYIELLDSSQSLVGKIAVQVKTVNKRDSGKNRYNCPTSLLGYAQITTDIVFLLAVDLPCKKVLYKYISKQLIKDNQNKENQKTITLHFDNSEELRQDNVDETLQTWTHICNFQVKLLSQNEELHKENEELKNTILMKTQQTTLSESDIREIQVFFDTYNRLLNTDFAFIKKIVFPNVWQRGVAIYSYSVESLKYSLFNINKGELIQPIVQLDPKSMFDNVNHNHDFAVISKTDNPIKKNPEQAAWMLLKKHVDDFIKNRPTIPFEEDFLIGFIHDYVDANSRHLHLSKQSDINIPNLIQKLKSKHPNIDSTPIQTSTGKLNIVYEALQYFYKKGINELVYPYPKRQRFGNTGFITDWYSLDTALQKAKQVIYATYRAYQAFIQKEFSSIFNDLDLFYGGNLISIILDGNHPVGSTFIHSYYFKFQTPSNDRSITIKTSDGSELPQPYSLFNDGSHFSDKAGYICFRKGHLNSQTIISGKNNCVNLFYELLKEHFDDYFERVFKTRGYKS